MAESEKPRENVFIFTPANVSSPQSPRSTGLSDALNALGHPNGSGDETRLREFLTDSTNPKRLLILKDAGLLSEELRREIESYLVQGGDLLLIGNPAEGLSNASPLGGTIGRYVTYEVGKDDEGFPLLHPAKTIKLSELSGPLTTATGYLRSKAMTAESLSTRFGRWIDWLPTQSEGQMILGSVSSTYISGEKNQPDRASIVSHLGVNDLSLNAEMLKRLLEPVIAFHLGKIALLNAGPSAFHYSPKDEKKLGGRILNRGASEQKVSVNYQVSKVGKGIVAQGARMLNLPPTQAVEWSETLAPSLLEAGDYALQIDIQTEAGKGIDRQFSRFTVSSPQLSPATQAVTVRESQFFLNDRPWFLRGLHYWLPLVVGQPDSNFWHHYLMSALYDPDQVDRDLKQLAATGINTLVVPYRDVREASSLRDFLVRCEHYKLRAMVYVENAHPLRYNLDKLREMIQVAQLDQQPTLLALDLAWEPHVGAESARAYLNKPWHNWIIQQYGSVEAAESVWNFKLSDETQAVRGPTDNEILEDGPWRVMIAAYRRFLDDRISLGYGEVTRAIKKLCPHLLVGTRTGYGGTGAYHDIDARLPFDMESGADHLDFISPEAYGLFGAWSGFLDGFLITEAARYAGRYRKPVVWMEYGLSALPVGSATWSPKQLDLNGQAEFYRNFTRLVDESQVNGAAAWWPVGGYRFDEKSDFGLFGVTGKPRPAMDILSRMGNALAGVAWKPDTWMVVDRDLHPRGLSVLIRKNREEFLKLRAEGKRVGFRTASEGLTTENFPLVGVGNVEYRGVGPLKGLNGEMHFAETQTGDSTQAIEPGSLLASKKLPASVVIRLKVLNTGRVTWSSAADSNGQVVVELARQGKVIAQQPISNEVKGGGREQIECVISQPLSSGSYSLTLASKRTGRFGSPLIFQVE